MRRTQGHDDSSSSAPAINHRRYTGGSAPLGEVNEPVEVLTWSRLCQSCYFVDANCKERNGPVETENTKKVLQAILTSPG
jgi:hypothetical protein